jgi:hypothetical protein
MNSSGHHIAACQYHITSRGHALSAAAGGI